MANMPTHSLRHLTTTSQWLHRLHKLHFTTSLASLTQEPQQTQPNNNNKPSLYFPKRGQTLDLECESLAFKGKGVCKVADTGFVVMCDRALHGEKFIGGVTRRKGTYAEKPSSESDSDVALERCRWSPRRGSFDTMEKRLGAVDRISQLPEDLLQHILSFLPMKQVVQSTTISKRWKEVWNMFPILEFDANFFDKDNWFVFFPEDEKHKRRQKKARLFEVVEQSLLSRRRQMLSIKKYTLNMFLFEPDMASCFDRWIGYAVDSKVEELTLAIEPLNGSRYILPQFVLAAKSIVALTLSRCNLESPCIKTNLSSLKKLSLCASYADDNVIQNLVAGCPLVEDMSICYCDGFKNLHLSGLVKLKKILLVGNPKIELVEIYAPDLYSANFSGPKMPPDINAAHCKNLKSLHIYKSSILTTKWLHDILSKLLVLESLYLGCCNMLEGIKISSHHLNKLHIFRCQKLVRIELDAPNLRALEYTGDVIDFCSTALALSLANLCFDSRNMEISWYAKQIELLSKFNHCSKLVKLQSETGKSLIVPEELRRTLNSPLYNVKKLNLRTHTVYTAPIEELVDSLLWISPHPETILIENALNKYSFEFSYNKPISEGGSLHCCNSFPASCWRHCIKNFKMENEIGIINKRFRTYNYHQIPDDAEILEKLKGYKDLEP